MPASDGGFLAIELHRTLLWWRGVARSRSVAVENEVVKPRIVQRRTDLPFSPFVRVQPSESSFTYINMLEARLPQGTRRKSRISLQNTN